MEVPVQRAEVLRALGSAALRVEESSLDAAGALREGVDLGTIDSVRALVERRAPRQP